MIRTRSLRSLVTSVALLALASLAVAACGGSNGTTAAAPAKAASSRQVPAVRVAKTRLGNVLVDSSGHTVYLFTKDRGTTSGCSGACATAWPPLRTGGKPTAGRGAKASLVGATSSQVTYDGHPLYRFIKDMTAGDTNGEGVTAFGGRWFAVSPTGKQVSKPASRASSPQAPAAATPAATPTPTSTPRPAPTSTPRPAPTSTPAPAKTPAASNGIPQNNGGDHDADNSGGPDDGDGGV